MKDSERPSAPQFPLTNNVNKTMTESPSDNRSNGTEKTPARPRTGWRIFKWTLATLFCVAVLVVGAVAGKLYLSSSMIQTAVNGAIHDPWGVIIHRDPLASFTPDQQFPPDKQSAINVMLLGCDHDYEERRPVPIMNTLGRSDAILLAHVDFTANTINVLSIPRDAAVHIPNHGIQKINAAHAIGGPDLSMETIKDVFGIDVDYYATLHFEGFQKVVDALGGVDVTVKKPLNYDDNWGNLHVHLQPGFQHLNGYKAMGYVRIRHSDSDFMRAERQHEFLEALRQRVESPTNLLKLGNALEALTTSIKTNLSQPQMLTLANFARKLPKANIQLATLPCNEGPSYVYIRVSQSEDILRRMFFDNSVVAAVNVNAPGHVISTGWRVRDSGYGDSSRSYGRRHRRHGQTLRTTSPHSDDSAPALSDPDTGPLDGGNSNDNSAGSSDSGTGSGDSGGSTGGNSSGSTGSGADGGASGGTEGKGGGTPPPNGGV